jgi:hypothetical protein
MELLERYLQAVGKYLPVKGRNDILAELRANLLEQAEDRQHELGRPLTLEEEEALLKQHGHPLLAATRYLPQRYLIGPAVFPYYWAVLKAALLFVFVAYVVLNALAFITQPLTAARVVQLLARFPAVAFDAACWITLVAAIVEVVHTRSAKCSLVPEWSPRKLPRVAPQARDNDQRTIAELIACGVFLLLVLAIPHMTYLLPAFILETQQYVQLAPVWHTVYWALVCLIGAQWLNDLAGFRSPAWRPVRPFVTLLGRCVGVIVWLLPLRAQTLFVLTPAGQSTPKYQGMDAILDANVRMGLRVALILYVLFILWEAVRMLRDRLNGADGHPASSGLAL